MGTLGLDASLIAPSWDVSRIEPRMEWLSEAGLRHLEVRFAWPRDLDGRRAAEFARRWNVEIRPVFALPAEIDPLERLQDGLDALEPALRGAADAGAADIVLHLPGRPGPRLAAQSRIDALCRFGERAARLARPHGVRLGLAPLSRSETDLLNSAAQAVWAIERIGAENVFAVLDTFHMGVEEESLARAFETAAPFLGAVRLSESNRGVPGRGIADWTAIFAALKEIGYSGPLTVTAQPRAGLDEAPAPWRATAPRLEEVVEEGIAVLR